VEKIMVVKDDNNNNNSHNNNNNNGNNNAYKTVEVEFCSRKYLIKVNSPSPTMVNIESGSTLKTNMRVVVSNLRIETITTTTTTITVDPGVETNVEETIGLVTVRA
jgi:hypothetical protein